VAKTSVGQRSRCGAMDYLFPRWASVKISFEDVVGYMKLWKRLPRDLARGGYVDAALCVLFRLGGGALSSAKG
jgi:hypothetical protein